MTSEIESAELETVEGLCSFCNMITFVIISPITSKTVCFKCVYKMNFQLGKLPAGAVCCFKCRAISGFKVHTKQGKQVEYMMTGRDFKGCVKYEVKGVKIPKSHIDNVTCASCGSNVPKWMLDFTSHV